MKWSRYVIVIACLVLTLTSCSHPIPEYESKYRPPLSEPPALAIAIIGDAHTSHASVGTLAWPALVAAQLLKQNINIEPKIATGSTLTGDDGHALTREIQRAVVPTTKVVVLFGSAQAEASSAVELSSAVQRAVTDIKATAPEARVLLVGPFWTDGQPPQSVLMIRDALKIDAKTIGAAFVDPIADGWFVNQTVLLFPDQVTLNDAGHAYLAGKMAPLIAQQLQPLPAGPPATPR